MSISQQHTTASLSDRWRTVNIDALDPESSQNFEIPTLHGALPQVSEAEARQVAAQVRQLLRGGDTEGALRGACESAPAGASDGVKDIHLQTMTEVLQSIKASEMTPMLQRVYGSEGGSDVLDMLMKYLYKGMSGSTSSTSSAPASGRQSLGRVSTLSPQSTGFSQHGTRPGGGESSGAAMSVLLSWHEKVVEVAGLGCIGRVMSDRRKV